MTAKNHIVVKNVVVDLPVYDFSSRSFKKMAIGKARNIGGIIRRSNVRNTYATVRAIDNVSFELKEGDRLAIVGHNGAGKSTLLRVLSGVYEPTGGSIEIKGNVLPIFDISIGMDYDCSGYENVYLRTLYLGEHLPYTEELVNDILDFAELGEFAALPVRTYSTGMLARLQFAITTAMRPDILVMDEGIGAGDAAFFDKAEARLDGMMSKSGIMILATHSEAMSKSMCNRAILMEKGKVILEGSPDEVWSTYYERIKEAAE